MLTGTLGFVKQEMNANYHGPPAIFWWISPTINNRLVKSQHILARIDQIAFLVVEGAHPDPGDLHQWSIAFSNAFWGTHHLHPVGDLSVRTLSVSLSNLKPIDLHASWWLKMHLQTSWRPQTTNDLLPSNALLGAHLLERSFNQADCRTILI